MNPVTVLTLGPGSRDYLTLGALNTLKNAKKLILRTGEPPHGQRQTVKGLAAAFVGQARPPRRRAHQAHHVVLRRVFHRLCSSRHRMMLHPIRRALLNMRKKAGIIPLY